LPEGINYDKEKCSNSYFEIKGLKRGCCKDCCNNRLLRRRRGDSQTLLDV
jgi:hypothetical protein